MGEKERGGESNRKSSRVSYVWRERWRGREEIGRRHERKEKEREEKEGGKGKGNYGEEWMKKGERAGGEMEEV